MDGLVAPQRIDTVVTREQAPAAMEQLRVDRINDLITESDYHARADYLRGVIDADPSKAAPAPPSSAPVTPEQQFTSQHDAWMTPPKPEQYLNLPSATAFGDDAEALNVGVTHALARAHVPQHLAAPILEGAYRSFDELVNVDESTRQARIQEAHAAMRKVWGADFQKRLDAVHDLVADMVEADESVSEAFDQYPWVFDASPASLEFLDRVAVHRENLKRRGK